jgi:type I restriction enzyme, S subunit
MNIKRSVTLADVAKIGAGQGAPQERSDFGRPGEPFIRAGSLEALCDGSSLSSLPRVSERIADKYKLRLYPANTVVFAKSGMSATKNKVYRLPKPCYVVNHLATLEPNAYVDAIFLRYFLESFRPARLIKDLSYPSISQEHIARVQLLLPDLTEQKWIAAILQKADRLRRMRRYASELSDRFLQSVFLETFGDVRSNDRRFSTTSIGDLLKLKSGASMTAANMGRGGKYPVYGGNGIHGYHTSYLFEEPQIVIGRVGIYCGAVHYTAPKCWISDNALYVAEKDKRLDDLYLVHALKEANLNQYADRAGQPLISQGRLAKVRLLLPPLPLQQKFAAIVGRFGRLRAQQREAERQAEHLFQTLLHRAFESGL